MSTSAHQVAPAFPQKAPETTFGKQQGSHHPGQGPRQSTPDQARGLQVLAHAIEYLLDSRLFDMWQSPSDAVAVRLLMACSRKVFNECEVLDTWPKHVTPPVQRRLQLQPNPR